MHFMPNELIETKIESLSHDGRGVATINCKTTFVMGALPNELVRCKITKKHRRYNDAQAIEIITPAPERTEPHCAHFGICGGCSMQHVDISAQVQLKQQVLIEQLKHFGKVTPETILPPLASKPWGYRRKARLGVRYIRKDEKIRVGFREKLSNHLTELTECPVLHPAVGTRLTALSELVRSLSQYEHIPQIEMAASDDAVALVFRHMRPLSADDLQKLKTFGEANQLQIYLQPNAPAAVHKIWPADNEIFLHYALPDYDLTMRFHPLDFTQVNGEINRLMIKQALELLQPSATDHVLDLFCGLGNFTLPLARTAAHVTGIEGSAEMVTRARENAAYNQLHNTEFAVANLMSPDPKSPWLRKKYQKILLDPPRTGAKEIIPHLARLGADRIVYVSCNPSTLARDAGDLVYNHQYKLKSVGVMNMFPHTSHIEAIALFEK